MSLPQVIHPCCHGLPMDPEHLATPRRALEPTGQTPDVDHPDAFEEPLIP